MAVLKLSLSEREKVKSRIISKTKKDKNGCWLWQAAKHEFGYGVVGIGCKTYRAHRVLYEITTNKEIGDKFLLHKCDVPNCINPAHLFIGTHQDNMDDMTRKKRYRHPCGEANHSKLTEPQVKEIRRLYKNGDITQKELAKQFNIGKTMVGNIILRNKWKHIP